VTKSPERRSSPPPEAPPDVSIVLPSYLAAHIAKRSVDELRTLFAASTLTWEVIVVDDGGGDFDVGQWHEDLAVTLLRLPHNRGKGAAVRAGMLAARGSARIFSDVDLPYGAAGLAAIVHYLLHHRYHIVIGDRTLPTSSYLEQLGLARRFTSRIATELIGRIVTGGFFDTQCGLKGVRGDVADALFPRMRVDRFMFDVELVYIALKHRLDIKRVPVRLERNETSTVHPVRDSVRGVADLVRIRWHQLRGRYDCDEISALAHRDFVEAATEAARLLPTNHVVPQQYGPSAPPDATIGA
jgi:dolichyl-phosphate beta-glucosyltransferase